LSRPAPVLFDRDNAIVSFLWSKRNVAATAATFFCQSVISLNGPKGISSEQHGKRTKFIDWRLLGQIPTISRERPHGDHDRRGQTQHQ